MRTNPDYYEKSVDNDVSLDIKNHWISCNIYPQSRKWVQKHVKYHFLKFKYLKNYSKMKKKDSYWREYNIFATKFSKLYDSIGDSGRIKGQKLFWGVKMTDTDWKFYKNMCLIPQIGYCSNIDKKCEETENGKQKTGEKREKLR